MTGFDMDGAAVKDIPAIRFGPLWSVMSARGSMTKKLDYIAAWNLVHGACVVYVYTAIALGDRATSRA